MVDRHGMEAFPRQIGELDDGATGMSLTDWFAGMALQALIIRIPANNMPEPAGLANFAYEIADAMLAERGQ